MYADGIPEQAAFDSYYRDMSKYEEPIGLSPAELPYYRSVVAAIAERLPDRGARLLDVGSAGGDALALFREAGYTNLTGFDPSPRCAEIARDRHGLRVINTPISQMPFVGEQFDVVMLSGVLEHLRDLRGTLLELSRLLSPTGVFWFGVPDARRFADYLESPFQHFSLEHINFFTLTTLRALLGQAGFELFDSWESVHKLGALSEPGLNAIFRFAEAGVRLERDLEGPDAVRRYTVASKRLEDRLCDGVRRQIDDRTPIIIWGTGTLALHLLESESFRSLNVVAFVDANANYWNKTIRTVPVIPPSAVALRTEPVLIISYSYEHEIATKMSDVYKLENPVLKLFSGF